MIEGARLSKESKSCSIAMMVMDNRSTNIRSTREHVSVLIERLSDKQSYFILAHSAH